MSDMKLEWQLEERRSDELGILENNLNTLSRKLSATLEELQSANLQLQKDIEHQRCWNGHNRISFLLLPMN